MWTEIEEKNQKYFVIVVMSRAGSFEATAVKTFSSYEISSIVGFSSHQKGVSLECICYTKYMQKS